MNRPQIKTPDGHIINLFSKEVENLLDKGYSLYDITGIRQEDFNLLTPSPNIPLTYIPEIDLHIFDQLNDMDELKQMCKINNYTKNLCQTRSYWLERINNEHLYLPSNLNIQHIDYIKLYEAAYQTTQFEIELYGSLIGHIKVPYLIFLLAKSNINIPDNIIPDDFLRYDMGKFILYIHKKHNDDFYEVRSHFTKSLFLTLDEIKKLIFYNNYYK
jgi:hypothetical protein